MILITTPNGKVGQEVAKQLIAAGHPVRIAAHTPEKARAAFPGAEVVPFDYEDEGSVRAALHGVTELYLASPGDMPAEPVNRVVDLAKAAGVRRVVRLSALGAEHGDNPLRDVERHVEASGLAWTFLRPSWFMQNYSTFNAPAIRGHGVVSEPAADARTGFVDARDIAAVAVAALTQPGHEGQAYAITGPRALSRDDVASAIASATGRAVRYQPLAEDAYAERLRSSGAPDAYVGMMTNIYRSVRSGESEVVTDVVRRVTGREPISFEQFARDHADVWR